MQQLASRLLVKNQDLYGRYDRQMAEASVRMNILNTVDSTACTGRLAIEPSALAAARADAS
jgi:hypothetical protein